MKQTNPKDIKNILPAKDNSDISFNSSILFLFQIEELKKFICQNKNLDLEIFKINILDKIGQNSSQLNTYDKIFDELLTKLDSNREINNLPISIFKEMKELYDLIYMKFLKDNCI